jgi:hypothetical protein
MNALDNEVLFRTHIFERPGYRLVRLDEYIQTGDECSGVHGTPLGLWKKSKMAGHRVLSLTGNYDRRIYRRLARNLYEWLR